MALPDIFSKEVSESVIRRLEQLTPNTPAKWGKMNVAQMLAHCNVPYEMIYENIHPRPGGFARLMLKMFVKGKVTGESGYAQGSRTAPAFVITDEKVFEKEKERLIQYIRRTAADGRTSFEGKESNSFGPLTSNEWNNMLYKHLDHHLHQFGA